MLTQGAFFFKVVNAVRCPFCEQNMEKGLLQSGGSMIVWVKNKHYFSLKPKAGEVVLDRNYLTGGSVHAWICKDCKRVVIEYTEKEEIEF